jgi:hypothetical protein
VCSHTVRKKKEFIEEERAHDMTLLGATCAMSPGRTMGKTGNYYES